MAKIYSTIKRNIELDVTNCDVSMTPYSNFLTHKRKNSTIFCSGPNFSLVELKFGTGVNLIKLDFDKKNDFFYIFG